ncbi:MAG TPA: hypothetical protein VD973_04080 [Symbiobacteriaceae bacterium]|nr:hypothetical protein [Symbiobacteriaceae bacterium]
MNATVKSGIGSVVGFAITGCLGVTCIASSLWGVTSIVAGIAGLINPAFANESLYPTMELFLLTGQSYVAFIWGAILLAVAGISFVVLRFVSRLVRNFANDLTQRLTSNL